MKSHSRADNNTSVEGKINSDTTSTSSLDTEEGNNVTGTEKPSQFYVPLGEKEKDNSLLPPKDVNSSNLGYKEALEKPFMVLSQVLLFLIFIIRMYVQH